MAKKVIRKLGSVPKVAEQLYRPDRQYWCRLCPMVVAALEEASQDKILFINYGERQRCDCIQVTDAILKLSPAAG